MQVVGTTRRRRSAIVREKFSAVVFAKTSEHRDIEPASCRAEPLDIDKAIAEGEAAVVPPETPEDDLHAQHDKQLGTALKTMRKELNGVVGFTFGTNESGDQDEFGPVIYVYVGISKTTGKLIGIITEAVYT